MDSASRDCSRAKRQTARRPWSDGGGGASDCGGGASDGGGGAGESDHDSESDGEKCDEYGYLL